MKPLLAKLRKTLRRELLAPTLDRLDEMERRLEGLDGRLAEVQGLLEEVLARAEASNERSLGVMESTAKNARRLEQLEQVLGAR